MLTKRVQAGPAFRFSWLISNDSPTLPGQLLSSYVRIRLTHGPSSAVDSGAENCAHHQRDQLSKRSITEIMRTLAGRLSRSGI